MGGARLYKLASTFNASELLEVDTEQTADIVYLAHIDHAPSKLERFGHTSWAFANVAFAPTIAPPGSISISVHVPNQDQDNGGDAYFPISMRYVVTAVDDDTGQESRASAEVSGLNDLTLKRNYNQISFGAVAGATRYRIYAAISSGAYGWIGDTSPTEGLTFFDDNITPDLTDAPPIGNNPFVADDGVTIAGYCPSTVALFEQRLLWGRTTIKPNGVWGSKSGSYENMDYSRPLKDDDSLAFALVGRRVNAVNQMVGFGTSGLLCLTTDGTFVVNGGGGDNAYLSPSAIVSRRQSSKSVARLKPIEADDVVFIKTSTGNEVRSIGYSFEIDGVKTTDLTIFSPHLFKGFDVVWWDYMETPRSMVIAGRSDGLMLCFTWEADQQVWGWTVWETDGFVFSGCVVPEDGEDRLYLGVRRTVGGVTRRYIERMSSVLWNTVNPEDPDVDDGCWLDAAVKYDLPAPARVFSGLDHLEGRTVNALVDGNVVSGLVVTGGAVTLPSPLTGSRVAVGLPYSSLIETLPLAFDGQDGTNQGKQQDTGQAAIRLNQTRGVAAGSTPESLYVLKPRSYEPYGESNTLKSGIYDVSMAPVQANETTLLIQQDQPLPMTLTAAFLEPQVSED